MFELTSEAQRIIKEFEDRVRGLSANERASVLRRMTTHINALNEEVVSLLQTLEKTREAEEDLDQRLDAVDEEIRGYK